MIAASLMLWTSNATAQGRLAVGSCVIDLRNLCPDIPPGNNNLRACMREHIRDVSSPCLLTLAKFAEVRGSLKECSAHLHQQCASGQPHSLIGPATSMTNVGIGSGPKPGAELSRGPLRRG